MIKQCKIANELHYLEMRDIKSELNSGMFLESILRFAFVLIWCFQKKIQLLFKKVLFFFTFWFAVLLFLWFPLLVLFATHGHQRQKLGCQFRQKVAKATTWHPLLLRLVFVEKIDCFEPGVKHKADGKKLKQKP